MMFMEKVKEQSLELERVRKRNKELKQTREQLEKECQEIADKIISTQVERAESLEVSIVLRKELNEEKSSYFRKMSAISEAERENEMLMNSLKETDDMSLNTEMTEKYMKEKLGFRKEMVECLQAELLEYRLRTAEAEAIIRELRTTIQELSREIEILRRLTPETVLQIRQELDAARHRELATKMEFANVKRDVDEVRVQCERRRKEKYKSKSALRRSSSFSKHKKWDNVPEELKREYETSCANLLEYTEEKKKLQNEISKIEHQIATARIQLESRDVELRDLFQKLTKREFEEVISLSEVQEKHQKCYKDVEENLREKLTNIRKNVTEKVNALSRLTSKLKKMETTNADNEVSDEEQICNTSSPKNKSRSQFFVDIE